MCYDASYLTKKAELYEKRFQVNFEEVERIKNQIGPHYHTSGFAHPDIPVITDIEPNTFQAFTWGLIPAWVKDPASAAKLGRQCLNARGETVFEKPVFKAAAMKKRCLVVVDGYFEHHWYNGKSYPFYIQMKNEEPFSLAGVWETWKYQDIVKNTVSIVTTEANPLLAKIHNNPKGSETHRMPLIFPQEIEKEWLKPARDQLDLQKIQEMIKAYDEEEMIACTVPMLRGKNGVGNKPEACIEVKYPDLVF